MPASRKKCGACLKLALPAPVEGKAACTHGGGKGCLDLSRDVLPVFAKCSKGHVVPCHPRHVPCLLGGSLPV